MDNLCNKKRRRNKIITGKVGNENTDSNLRFLHDAMILFLKAMPLSIFQCSKIAYKPVMKRNHNRDSISFKRKKVLERYCK